MQLNSQVVLGYSDIFDDDTPSCKDLLEDLPKEKSLELITHFHGQLHSNERNNRLQLELLELWLSNQAKEVVQNFTNEILRRANGKGNINFFNNISCLYLIQKILIHCDEQDRELRYEDELNLLKCYLIVSEEWTKKSHQLLDEDKEYKTEEDIIQLVLPSQLPIHENKLFKDFRIEFLKSIYLFRFLEKNKQFDDILDEFVNKKQVDNWEEYLVKILSLYIRELEAPNIKTKLEVEDESVRNLLDTFCINDIEVKDDVDFISIRNKPIFKTEDDDYLFLSLNLFIDKLYQGLLFDIFYNSDIAQDIYGNIPTFRSNLGNDFSEKSMFYEFAQNYLCQGCVHLNENDIPDDIEISPDYYIRHNTKIIVIEFKDVLLSKKVKYSYDLEEVKEGIFKKIVESEDGKKGITQLIDTIDGLQDGAFEDIDPDCDFSTVKYYPVVVITDNSFEQLGINYLIKKEFKKRLEEYENIQKENIKEPVIMVFDELLKFQDLFNKNKLKLRSLIDQYNAYVKSDSAWRNIASFNEFIHMRTLKMSTSSPEQLFEEIDQLLVNFGEEEV
jgi:hypothetical protein